MADRIIVINPNSTEAVTAGIDAAVAPLRFGGGPEIECVTLSEGPPAIESQADADAVVGPITDYVRRRDNEAGAYVIACFSDPGLWAAREASRHPVMGIAEAGILAALTLGEKFGIISILGPSVARHMRYVRSLGLGGRLAGDLPLGLGVLELAEGERVIERMISVGETLRDDHGADVIVMGCAGMAHCRDRLSEALDRPVIEPCQAATGMAISALRLGWRHAR